MIQKRQIKNGTALFPILLLASMFTSLAFAAEVNTSAQPHSTIYKELTTEQRGKIEQGLGLIKNSGAIYDMKVFDLNGDGKGLYVEVFVTPAFNSTPYETKEAIARSIAYYYAKPTNETCNVYFMDYSTHKKLGSLTILAKAGVDNFSWDGD